jgi:hypothetical protein
MKAPSETRRLPKGVFVLGDILLVGTAWVIEAESDKPLTAVPIIAIVVCVVLAAVLFVIPFLADYSRSQEAAFAERQNALQALAVTLTASAEQISIAASGLDRLATVAQENFNQSDRMAQQIHERMVELHSRLSEAKGDDAEAAARVEAAATRIGELHTRLTEARADDGGAVARLEAVAKRIGKAVSDLESAASRAAEPPRPAVALEVPPVLASRIVEIKPAVAPSGPPFVAPPSAVAPSGPPFVAAPFAVAPAPAAPAEPTSVDPPPAASTEPPAPAPASETPVRKRSPRKAAPPGDGGELILEPAAPAPEAPAAAAADGATRLVVTAYIGIGNRLFIRGTGPGLSWEKGVPLSFVSIGKWRWETGEASAPVRFKLYKNDEIECTALGERSVDPGVQQTLTASF